MLLLASTFTFTACGDDDDDATDGFSIVGTWYEYEWDVEGIDAIYVFKEDGTGTCQEYYEGELEPVDNFTYELVGTKLTLYYDDDDDPSVMNIKIKSATEFTYTEGEGTLTFKKQV